MSFAGIPAVELGPKDIAPKQWQRIFVLGVTSMPPIVISAAAGFAWLAYKCMWD